MIKRLLVLTMVCDIVISAYLYDDESTRRTFPTSEEMEFEPVTTLTKDKEKMVLMKNINCEDFSRYALNCTVEAAIVYNSSRKSPPMPAKVADWCKAIRHLTNCAIDWNSDCREVTENHFNEESIKGHIHVVDNICDDEWFLSRYDDLPMCIEATSDEWEACYSVFKQQVDEQKNKTLEWTHFETHFYLCCARAQFRRCTLESLFSSHSKCTHEQSTTLQKFSVIVSEGDVFQDCDSNMMYANCPEGDPRPTKHHLSKLMNIAPASNAIRLCLRDMLFVVAFVLCLMQWF
ncbi:uncharacterized protein LOC114363566 [Ostrinia furnacalis]|uniref:uncharacterized protein LOC114363566 n=1 Tax=Ostrinia furnacalis TaxID=93504 RepID=UPI00103DAD43|nr:uncharacterized protein LOC114363566 [Ostrinia furnacalis]